MGQVLTDERELYPFDLKPGKYQLAAALFNTTEVDDLDWGEPVASPTREKDTKDLQIRGSMTLASPYQTQQPSMDAPWDDHLREQGAASIISSTDWGELTDGFPEGSLPADNDLHTAYVAFDQPQVHGLSRPPEKSARPLGLLPALSRGLTMSKCPRAAHLLHQNDIHDHFERFCRSKGGLPSSIQVWAFKVRRLPFLFDSTVESKKMAW